MSCVCVRLFKTFNLWDCSNLQKSYLLGWIFYRLRGVKNFSNRAKRAGQTCPWNDLTRALYHILNISLAIFFMHSDFVRYFILLLFSCTLFCNFLSSWNLHRSSISTSNLAMKKWRSFTSEYRYQLSLPCFLSKCRRFTRSRQASCFSPSNGVTLFAGWIRLSGILIGLEVALFLGHFDFYPMLRVWYKFSFLLCSSS